MTRLEQTVAALRSLVAFPTVSTDSNLALIDWLAERLEAAGARVDVLRGEMPGKANLFATIGPDGPGGIVLSGHTDVVPVTDQDWTSDPFEMSARDGRLYGRGTCDMKGFIAAALASAPLFSTSIRPIHFAFTHDEEVGCLGAQAMIPALIGRGIRPGTVIVGEPTGMKVIEGHKGCCEYRVRFEGAEGHGSDPDAGVNAAEYAARYVAHLLDLRERLKERAPPDSRFVPPWTTLNVGRITGGVSPNVIAGKAEVEWEFRPVSDGDFRFVKSDVAAAASRLLRAMQADNSAATILTETLGEVAGLEPMAENAARDLVSGLMGVDPATAGTVPFGTEAGLFQAEGMDVVVCGPGHIAQAHKPDEFIEASQLSACLDMLERLADRISK